MILDALVLCSIWTVLIPSAVGQTWQMPDDGLASMTHYDLPVGDVASCGCVGDSSGNYPTAALNQLAFGSAAVYGPGCGRCFNLTLLDTWTGTPPFYPTVHPSVVIKVTDLCPASSAHCQATASKPNEYGWYVHFDLAYPSLAIPEGSFYPSNASYYGYTDFGVWNISYQAVPCIPDWAGSSHASAMGSVANMGTSVCCPANPSGNDTCPSYSASYGIPPDTTTSGVPYGVAIEKHILIAAVFALCIFDLVACHLYM